MSLRVDERVAAAVAAAAAIDGWMTLEELDWLARTAVDRDTIVEVGSWQGRSTKALAMMTPGVVYSVDTLVGETQHPISDLDRRFRLHLAAELDAGKVEVIRESSHVAAKRFADASVSMVFIDANHDAPHPAADIEAWAPVVGAGLLCGHDRDCPGVQAALAGRDWVSGPGSIWVLP